MAHTPRRLSVDWLNFNSKSSTDYPLVVNTAGYFDAFYSFETYNSIGRDDYYLIYVINGQLSICIDNKEYIAQKGSAIIFPPKYKYKYRGNPPTYYLFVHFTGSYAERFLNECGYNSLPCIIDNDFSVEIHNKFNLMVNTFLYNGLLSNQKCSYLLQDILISIFESSLERADESLLKASLKYIHSSFTTKIDVPYLARLENLSNSRYITVFKKHTGKSPNEYIIELRLQFAKNLINSTNMSIKQIGEHVGYTDPYYFSRLFKKYIGISPAEYRNKNE